ncbi:hypothetical protein HCU01_01930 [Halomonas cupida]|uniref:Uncharacterized protein n=1 Tax=Halomonas cupida TaxID=44933 RepID=A0ABQ0W9A7_9GAMM|nr:hypothetical protein HCU01_01930 [Halomonas cupida]
MESDIMRAEFVVNDANLHSVLRIYAPARKENLFDDSSIAARCALSSVSHRHCGLRDVQVRDPR